MTDLHALVAPYALDAVDDLDRRRFDAHLLECESCTAQIAGFTAAAAALGSAQTRPPPVQLRSRILSTASAVPQDRTFSSRRPRRTWRRILPAVAVAAALVVPTAGAAQYLADRPGAADSTATATVSSVLAAPDAATRSRSVDGGGSVRVVTSHARGAAIVAADRLPPLADGRIYQVWTMTAGRSVSHGTFASSTVVTADQLGSADRVAVTVEPAGGSVRPTSLPVAVLPL